MAVLRFQDVDTKQIEEALHRATVALAPNVVHIRYSLEDDWSGDPAVYFRVLLADDAVPNWENWKGRKDWKTFAGPLSELTKRIRARVLEEVEPYERGRQPYFRFRTVSEQAGIDDPTWK